MFTQERMNMISPCSIDCGICVNCCLPPLQNSRFYLAKSDAGITNCTCMS
jgi:hypothetical protein